MCTCNTACDVMLGFAAHCFHSTMFLLCCSFVRLDGMGLSRDPHFTALIEADSGIGPATHLGSDDNPLADSSRTTSAALLNVFGPPKAQPVHPRVVCCDPYPGVDGIVVTESCTDIHQVQHVVVLPYSFDDIGG